MKKIGKRRVISCLLCGLLALPCSFIACKEEVKGNGKNLIYIIGDGMGFSHIENAKLYMEVETLPFEEYYVGEVTTYSASNSVTDSAAAATALATGSKTNNGYIGIATDKTPLESIMEISKKEGKRTGVITTDTLDGATPAGFSAQANDRDNTYEILASQAQSRIDLFVASYKTNYKVSQNQFTEKGYGYAESLQDLKQTTKKKAFGNVKNLSPVYGADDPSAVVSLKSVVEYALDYLSKDNENGFTLMVEGAYIDKHSHANDLIKMIYAMMDLNDAAAYILEWAKGRADTSVIITADHETGGLQTAASKAELSNSLYLKEDHSSANVPLYLYNAAASGDVIDNTDVFEIAKSIVVG